MRRKVKNFKFKHELGQNFLNDEFILDDIVSESNINDKDYAVRNDTISFFYLDKNSLFIDIVNVSGEKETKTITLINANKIDVYYNDNNSIIFIDYVLE